MFLFIFRNFVKCQLNQNYFSLAPLETYKTIKILFLGKCTEKNIPKLCGNNFMEHFFSFFLGIMFTVAFRHVPSLFAVVDFLKLNESTLKFKRFSETGEIGHVGILVFSDGSDNFHKLT